jgi:toxin secretion/phage lysis holin
MTLERTVKIAMTFISGIYASMQGDYITVLFLVGFAIILDLATGIIKAILTTGMSKEKAFKGVIKKFAMILGLLFGVLLDGAIPFVSQKAGIIIPFSMPFSMIIGAYIILTECISICENLYEINPKMLPNFIKKILTTAKDTLKGSNENDTIQGKK